MSTCNHWCPNNLCRVMLSFFSFSWCEIFLIIVKCRNSKYNKENLHTHLKTRFQSKPPLRSDEAPMY